MRQCYIDGWFDICPINPVTEEPHHIERMKEENDNKYGKNESINETKNRFIQLGINSDKIVTTEIPSVGVWDTERNCFGDKYSDPKDNVFFSLQNRTEILQDEIEKINNSTGIIITNATYGKPYFRYDYIPNKK